MDWNIPPVSLPDESCFYGAGASGNNNNLPFCLEFPSEVTLTGPVPEVPDSMFCDDDPLTLVYTVENPSDSEVILDIFFVFTAPYITLNGGTCLDTDPNSVPANGTCTIEVLITPECDFVDCSILIEALLEVAPELSQDPLFDTIPVAIQYANYARYPAKTAELSHSSVTPQKFCHGGI